VGVVEPIVKLVVTVRVICPPPYFGGYLEIGSDPDKSLWVIVPLIVIPELQSHAHLLEILAVVRILRVCCCHSVGRFNLISVKH
jgi:hypothetical protein